MYEGLEYSVPSPTQSQPTMRRRNVQGFGNGSDYSAKTSNGYDYDKTKKSIGRKVVRNLDLFPKVEQDLTVKTEQGGMVSLIGYGIIFCLVLAELLNHMALSRETSESLVVDTSLSQKMQVNMNITFPDISCVDLHLDVMDVAGDSQLDIDDTLVKKRLTKDGKPVKADVIKAETNKKHNQDLENRKHLKNDLGDDYCGPCYGAHENEDDCCDTCDDVINAYKKKSWNARQITNVAEQCVREGKTDTSPKRIAKGEGCNLSGFMNINRVAGNFHVALGEGVERDGRHIHLFIPDDAPLFNTTHIIHELTFGPSVSKSDHGALDNVKKIADENSGKTGLFQYFIKVVPTVYQDINGDVIGETNRYFFTERYRPLMTELIGDEHYELAGGEKKGDNDKDRVGIAAGGHGKDSLSKQEHHHQQNSILPGVFFVYEIYPFAVVVKPKNVPLSHLLIRIFALVGGIITIVGWVDGAIFVRGKKKSWQ